MKKIYNNKFLNITTISISIIAFYSFIINFYFASFGVYPIDTFLHYDSAYRILNSELPVRDYWIVSGFMIEFLQSIFFKVFGVNWTVYIFHSSMINVIVSILCYFFFLTLKIPLINSLIYALSFSTLAYSVSGTPFVDHHAVFLLLISSFLMLKFFDQANNKINLFLILLLSFSSFLIKQVPAGYAFLFQGGLILFYIFKYKKLKLFKRICLYFIIILISFFLFLTILKIDFELFVREYILYPSYIGSERFLIFNKSFEIFFNQYKFLFLPILLTIYTKFKLNLNTSKQESNELFKYLIILFLSASLIFHQLLTKNQIFIYFLIPLFFGILNKDLNIIFPKIKKIISGVLIIILLSITLKYHFRYNEERKFHELSGINFNNTVDAKNIHYSLKGLRWINPFFRGKPQKEIELIKEGISQLENQKENLMLVSNYLFINSITKKNMNLPTRTFTIDGASYPLANNKYFSEFKKFLRNHLKKKGIKKVYFFNHENLNKNIITDYLSKDCIKVKKNKLFTIFEITCLN